MPERSSKKKRDHDMNQLAVSIVEDATGESLSEIPPSYEKIPAALALGRLGGKKCDLARAKN